MQRIFGWTRYIVLLGVVGSLLVSATLFVAGAYHSLEIVYGVLSNLGRGARLNAVVVDAVSHADDFLIATALYMISIGLYVLFIGKVDLPGWLQINSLDDLKDRLIGVVVVVMAVTFLGEVSDWNGERNVLVLGVSISAVIISLAVFSWISHRRKSNGP